ncbi:exopolysaccharide biosynthesis protein [Maritimibacter dapengensis]|uniref:Exopolysaccharide biosynthesis protein n=1 Tax=Maritimibacter dapengensis TaxID=2836868 RepID=A0ABS6T170_9RHOB|nr:exopolysaccharide biosynthesis protein [Maritimibacter dapengensis]MBV7378839.1 exopolysaccharide biosynthesis protein [Maritimibacter dapengensis]
MTDETAESAPRRRFGARANSVMDVIDRARGALRKGGDEVTVRDVVESLGKASFAPLLLVPALVVVTPASGIPLLSSICGISIALIAAQMVLGRDHVWLPKWIMRRGAPKARMETAFDWIAPIARFLDRITRQRLCALVEKPLLIVPQILAFLCGAVMPLLEVLPFTSSMLGATVSLLAVGMVTRDGLLVVLGVFVILATIYTGHSLLTSDAMAATAGALAETAGAMAKTAGEAAGGMAKPQ